ncbi:TonB-dependent siderophore receptor [Pleurocapsa sp. CCALA 161]|uniref:TonB-dependent siderophore receptor n=1 Tax=Pleurocapsa sp. CCALA 161 TaxID=2107688 RepID=UPI001304D9B1|nr:TonB-dependent siderophore receptor [Pleurocapsa sp. CCALA 161]
MRKYLLGWNLFVFLAIAIGQIAVAEISLAQKAGGQESREGEETYTDRKTGRKGVLKDIALSEGVPQGDTASHISFRAHNKEKALVEKFPSPPSVVDLKQDLIVQGVTRVTGVEINQTAEGLELILKTTAESERLVPLILPEGNDLVIDILDATLAFSIRNGVTELNPAPGISRITVNEADDNSIQVRITGENQTPSAEILPGRDGLVLSIAPKRATAEEPDEEIEVIATGQGAEEEYLVPDVDIGGRIDAPLRDVPQSIQVIPQQVIEDQQATGLEEVLENAAGVTFLGNNDGRAFEAAIRGFRDARIARDGFGGFPGFSADSAAPETANLERVEILKGPSTLFGQAEPGGIINLVRKKPLAEPYYNLQFQLGNRNFYSPSIDLSGPLTGDGNLLYRFNALYRTQDSFRNFEDSLDRFFIAPTIAWQIGDRTNLTFNLEYAEDNDPVNFGTVAFGEGIADIPLERVTNNPDDSQEFTNLNVGYTLEHNFSENWQLRNRFRYASDDGPSGILALPFNVDESTGELTRLYATEAIENEEFSLFTNVRGKFDTGSLKHNLLFGVDLSRADGKESSGVLFEPASPIDIFDSDPDYFAVPLPDREELSPVEDLDRTTDRLGIYLQDQIDLLDNLILAAGVRYDIVDLDLTDNLTGEETNQNDDAVTPNIGIVYQPIEPISLYANYSQSFVPNTENTDADGEPLEPETGEGFDVGIKAEILENRLSATLGYFNITKQNVAVNDPSDPVGSALIATGEQQSEGFDIDLSGQIMPGWNIIASYAFIDAEVTEDTDPEFVGSKLTGIPENSASLWTTYELQKGSLQGLGFGAGFNFVGERQGGLPNSFTTDSYFLTNAALFYSRDNWQVRLNFDNLFDVDFIESVNTSRTRFNYPGDPFTVRGSVAVEF